MQKTHWFTNTHQKSYAFCFKSFKVLEYLLTAYAFIIVSILNVVFVVLNYRGWDGDVKGTQ